jgi:hypothetical protein
MLEIRAAEPLVPDPSTFEVEIAIAKLKRYYKSPGSDQTLAELIQAGAGGEVLCSKISKLINSIWNKGKLLRRQVHAFLGLHLMQMKSV